MSGQKSIPKYLEFFFGGSAGMLATCVVQPLDLVKTRMQLGGGKANMIEVIGAIIKNEGFFTLYTGLSAGLLRQATYTTTRLGVFNMLLDAATGPNGEPPNFAAKIGMGMVAGVCGAFVGTPAEVALIRMTSDGRLPPNERRNYKNVVDALLRIVKEEGVLALWRGAVPTMSRALVVNAAQLSTYSQAKEYLVKYAGFKDGIFLHFSSSMISGFVTTVASMPVDIAKTRIQNMKIINGVPEYKGATDVVMKIIQKDGVFALWNGFMPTLFRIGPHTVFTFIFLEQMKKAYYAM